MNEREITKKIKEEIRECGQCHKMYVNMPVFSLYMTTFRFALIQLNEPLHFTKVRSYKINTF